MRNVTSYYLTVCCQIAQHLSTLCGKMNSTNTDGVAMSSPISHPVPDNLVCIEDTALANLKYICGK